MKVVLPPSVVFILVLTLMLSGCAAPAVPGDRQRQGASPVVVPKVLTLGILQEPLSLNIQISGGTQGAGGASQILNVGHDTLMVEDTFGTITPQLALQPPSLRDGTWRVGPDGTMETTWKLRPGIKWHDGQPFTASDLAFSFQVYRDPLVPNKEVGNIAAASSARALDPHTFVISWSSTFAAADEAKGLAPLPEHILRGPYDQDRTALEDHPWFTTEFIGLGPYRLESWDRGVQLRFVRFDDYYQGRPPLDVLIVRFTSDANSLIASILSGAIDVAFPPTLGLETQLEVKQRWEGTGNDVIVTPRNNVRYLELQVRPEVAEPRHGMPNRLVRQALYHALDRQGFTQAVCSGVCPVADSWISPANPLRSAVESAIPQYPFNPAQAAELLGQAGWTRGADGVLLHRESGERFRLMVHGSPDAERETVIAADMWKAIGVELNLYTIPRAQENSETRSKLPGAGFSSTATKQFYTDRLHSRYVTSAANHWSGANRTGYSNPRFDAAVDRLVATIDPPERVPLHRELLQEGMGDVPIMPTYWLVEAALVLKGVQGIRTRSTWNIFEWDIARSA